MVEIQCPTLSGQWRKGVKPAVNTVNWYFSFAIPTDGQAIKYKIKIYRAPFDEDVTKWSSYDQVYETNLFEEDHFIDKVHTEEIEIPVSDEYTYRAKVTYRVKRNNGIWQQLWRNVSSNIWNVYSSCEPEPVFTVNGYSSNVVMVTPDAAISANLWDAVSCNKEYVFSIQESNDLWQAIGPENLQSLHENELNQYGGKSSFNLKAFNDSFGTFTFQDGKAYRIKLAVGPPWTERVVLLRVQHPCSPSVAYTLNGQVGPNVSVPASEPLLLDFSNTISCTGDYFIEVLPSDADWNSIGTANNQWLSASALSQFGGIGAFNLQQFNESFGTFELTTGQYYRIKVAVSEPWTEHVVLLHIDEPCVPSVAYTLNGVSEGQLTIPIDYPFLLDLSNTVSCTGDYYISVLPSDAAWNSIGEENGQWLATAALSSFGGPNAFNLQQFNQSFGTFTFTDGNYYRIKVAVSEPWTEHVVLLLVGNPVDDTRHRKGK